MNLTDELLNSATYQAEYANKPMELVGEPIKSEVYSYVDANGTHRMPYSKFKARVALLGNFTVQIPDPENPKQSLQRRVRYCDNQESIFMDEQSEDAIETKPTLLNGFLFVPETQEKLKLFLLLHPQLDWGKDHRAKYGASNIYLSSKKEARVRDEEAQLMAIQNSERTKAHASNIAWNEPDVRRIKALAAAMGINTTNATESSMRYSLSLKASEDPAKLLETFNSEDLEYLAVTQHAFVVGILKFGAGGMILFKDEPIVAVPPKQDYVSWLAAWFKTDPKATLYFANVRQAVNVDFSQPESLKSVKVGVAKLSAESPEEIFDRAKSGNLIKYTSKEGFTYGEVSMGTSKKLATEFIKENSQIQNQLLKDLALQEA
jgi:hypothetical protein